MTFLILTETSAGYALFKAKDKKLLKRDDLAGEMSTPEGAAGLYVAISLSIYISLEQLLGENWKWQRNNALTANWVGA